MPLQFAKQEICVLWKNANVFVTLAKCSLVTQINEKHIN